MSDYCISLFGKFQVEKDNLVLKGFEAAKMQELFCYLLLHQNQPHHREHLANVLWPEQSAPSSKKYLRKALWQLQGCLSQQCENSSEPYIIAEDEWIQLNLSPSFHVDTLIFERACEKVREISGSHFSDEQADLISHTVKLYRGDLLQGWYQDWCLFKREHFLQMYLNLCDKLIRYCTASGTYESGIAYGNSILTHDRAREHTHRQLMRLHYLSGNRTEAIRQFKRCVQALHDELGVEPARLTETLYQQICADIMPTEAPVSISLNGSLSGKDETESLAHALQKLKNVQGDLTHMQQDLQQEIVQIESKLNPPSPL